MKHKKVPHRQSDTTTQIRALQNRNAQLHSSLQELLKLIHPAQPSTYVPEWVTQALEHSPSLVVMTDNYGKILYANSAVSALSGYSKKELLGSQIQNSLLQGQEGTFAHIASVLHSGRSWKGKIPHQCKRSQSVLLEGAVFQHEDGLGVPQFVGLWENVSDHAEIQKEKAKLSRELSLLDEISGLRDFGCKTCQFCEDVSKVLKKYVGFDSLYFGLVDPETDALHFPYATGPIPHPTPVENVWDKELEAPFLTVIRTGRPFLWHPESSSLPRSAKIPASWFGLPLRTPQRIGGILCLQHSTAPERFSRDDFKLLKNITPQLALSFEQIRFEEELNISQMRSQQVLDTAHDMELWKSPESEQLLYVSPSCERLTGRTSSEFMENPDLISRIVHVEDRAQWVKFYTKKTQFRNRRHEFRIVRKDGEECWVCAVCKNIPGPDGKTDQGLRCSLRDITKHKKLEENLSYKADHDSLTGLTNRNVATRHAKQVMAKSRRRKKYNYAVIFLDLDRFKFVNDSFGHSCGDSLLKEVAGRLLSCIRETDTVSRYGGDEFIIVLDELENRNDAIKIVKRIRESLALPFLTQDKKITLSASFGLVLSPSNEPSPEEMIRSANIALHVAKESGRNKIRVFSKKMLERVLKMSRLEHELQAARKNNQFFLVYQPIFETGTEKLSGMEALCRWQHPKHGLLYPKEFIPIAEESGDIIDLGLWVLREACSTMAAWHKNFPELSELIISVNISAVQFRMASLVDQVSTILEETQLQPDKLNLEITESTIMENAESALFMLKRLKTLGIRLSIDDFGTGYSSLSYLRQFPVTSLKVDKSFTADMLEEENSLEIIKAMLALANAMKLEVIVEGVEQSHQLKELERIQCKYVQGFHLARPLSLEKAEDLLAKTHTCLEAE